MQPVWGDISGLWQKNGLRERRMLATCPVLLVKNVGLQSMHLHPRTRGPMVWMWTLLQKLQAILPGAGQWRLAIPPNFSGMRMNSTKRNQFQPEDKDNGKYYRGTWVSVPSCEDIVFISHAKRTINGEFGSCRLTVWTVLSFIFQFAKQSGLKICFIGSLPHDQM